MELIPEPTGDGRFVMPPIATAEALAQWTDGDIAADDPRLDVLMRGASAAIRRYAGWHIAPAVRETVTVVEPYGGGRLDVLLPTLRVRNVTAIRVDGRALPASRIVWDASGAIWAGTLSRGTHRIEVDLEHGYHLSEVPDLASVVVQVAALAVASPKGATREQAGQVSVTWAQTSLGVSGGLSLLDRDLAIVDAFRIAGAP